jgi:hypothetical protein
VKATWGKRACNARSPFARTKCPAGAGHDESAPARERFVKCGVINKFLTNFEDLIEVYLLGIQLVMK